MTSAPSTLEFVADRPKPVRAAAAAKTAVIDSGGRLAPVDSVLSATVNMSDEKVMQAFVRGDRVAFERLFEQHKGGIYRYFLRLTSSPEDAEDLTQEIWINVFRNRASYQPKSKFTTWLYAIAHNRLIDHYRKNSRGVPISYGDDADLDDFVDASMADPFDQLNSNRQVRDVFTAIEALPEAQREAFLLREEGDLSLDEIADATHVTRETAKSRLRYAVAKLRKSVTVS